MQDAPELLIGLRTGFCGSLTTFASWEFSLVLGLIGGAGVEGGQWAEFLWGLVVGLQLALSSYMFGESQSRGKFRLKRLRSMSCPQWA